jgi:hypothetical protein
MEDNPNHPSIPFNLHLIILNQIYDLTAFYNIRIDGGIKPKKTGRGKYILLRRLKIYSKPGYFQI